MRNAKVRGAAAGLLWLVAIALMIWDLVDGPREDEMGRLALLVGMAAATCTVLSALRHARRVILEVMTWELWMRDSMNDIEEPGRANVRAIR